MAQVEQAGRQLVARELEACRTNLGQQAALERAATTELQRELAACRTELAELLEACRTDLQHERAATVAMRQQLEAGEQQEVTLNLRAELEACDQRQRANAGMFQNRITVLRADALAKHTEAQTQHALELERVRADCATRQQEDAERFREQLDAASQPNAHTASLLRAQEEKNAECRSLHDRNQELQRMLQRETAAAQQLRAEGELATLRERIRGQPSAVEMRELEARMGIQSAYHDQGEDH